jgi:hypothetical protein
MEKVLTLRTEVLMTMGLLAQELKGLDLNLLPVSVATLHLPLITSTLRSNRVRMLASKLKSLNQQPKLQDSNDPVPTAHRRHPRTQPAVSASLILLLNSQAVPQLHPLEDHHLVKARPQPPELHQLVPVPAALKHQIQL